MAKASKDQKQKFIDAAREVGTDEDPEAFKERLKKLVKAPAKPGSKQASKKK